MDWSTYFQVLSILIVVLVALLIATSMIFNKDNNDE